MHLFTSILLQHITGKYFISFEKERADGLQKPELTHSSIPIKSHVFSQRLVHLWECSVQPENVTADEFKIKCSYFFGDFQIRKGNGILTIWHIIHFLWVTASFISTPSLNALRSCKKKKILTIQF